MLVKVVQVQLDAVVHKSHLRPQGKLDNHPLLDSYLLVVGPPIRLRDCRNIVVLVVVAAVEAVAVDPTQIERQEDYCRLVDMVYTVHTAQRFEEEVAVEVAAPKGM